jgi:hypothetical protein
VGPSVSLCVAGGLGARFIIFLWSKRVQNGKADQRTVNLLLLFIGMSVHIAAFVLNWLCFLKDYFDSYGIGSLCCVLFGLGDNVIVIVIYMIQKQVLPPIAHSSAVAAFKTMQSFGSAAAFLYADSCALWVQVLIQIVLVSAGVGLACIAELKYNRSVK